jgi:ubiquinone/menaquinone biosynthesis C-methylase UbiE
MNKAQKQFYDSSNKYLESLKKHDKCVYEEFLEICMERISSSSLILECGCGVGRFASLFAQKGFNVVGVDISSLFISEAIKRYSKQPSLKFFVEDVENMSFSSESFDEVCSVLFLEHAGNIENTIREMHRVLKIGGDLIINMPNFLDPIQHLNDFINWKSKPNYKPWEAKSRMGAFCQFIRTSFLVIMKAYRINRKIYYLTPILLNNDDVCGQDFDATWLANAYDIKNMLIEMGMSVKIIFPKSLDGEERIVNLMKIIGFPKSLQYAYKEMRASGFTVIAKK